LRTGFVALATILGVGCLLRLWALNRYGFNSDEAVYAGQAASLAGHAELSEFFPTFRSHPLLFQVILSLGFELGGYDLFGRVLSAAIGLGTVLLTYRLGYLLYGRTAGLIAAGLIAVMPYHVLVTRQVLLDGPMVFCATLTLYLVARYAVSGRPLWLYAAGGAMGLTFLAKETSILLVGAIYAFFALSPEIRVRFRHLVGGGVVLGAVMAAFPLSMAVAGRSETGGQYLAWQLFRRPNHGWTFYPTQVTEAIGIVVVLAALAGLVILWNERSWRERLLLSWIAVPVIFFELWPVKGFQYLLPIAPPMAVLAARAYSRSLAGIRVRLGAASFQGETIGVFAAVLAGLSLFLLSWARIQPATTDTFLAGSGGVPGGREVGAWIKANVPEGAQFLTVGPSMANIVQYYGHRRAFGLSVSPNPLRRNPAYAPVENPDLAIRDNELQYLVWDSFSAARSPFFGEKLHRYADRYNGRIVHSQVARAKADSGASADKPLIIIYHVRPALAAPAGGEDD
jgi:4-amino-4-deoxy-L-arabinose transferase-like glycosyltransferase